MTKLPQPDPDSPFHAGELAVQTLSGVEEEADYLGRRMIRPYLSEPHQQFFQLLPYLLVGSVDEAGQPWASMLTGTPGFVHSPDPHTLAIDAQPVSGDPLTRSLHAGAAIGVLGIQLQSRRRNRMNGRVRALSAEGFTLDVDQSFGNCPKYISGRTPVPADTTAAAPRAEGARLSDAAADCVAAADTCFIASASASAFAPGDVREGVDVSHRGGKPGFVRVQRSEQATTLLMPDFAGNNAFNTLGNLARYPRAGLLFPDFTTGDALLLACDAQIIWDGPELARFHGAQRLVALSVRSGWYMPRYMPFRWSEPVPGLQNERTRELVI